MQCLTPRKCDEWRARHSRRHAWKRQITCVTPIKRLPAFVQTIVALAEPFAQALLVVDQVVFDTRPWLAPLRTAAGERRPVHEAPGHRVDSDPADLAAVLEAALSAAVDFRLLFSPPLHALRADHDDYTTFFSESPGKVADVRRAWLDSGLTLPDYEAAAP